MGNVHHGEGETVRIQGGIARSRMDLPRASYEDFKSLLDTRLARIHGDVSEWELGKVIDDWQEQQNEINIDRKIIEHEAKRLAIQYERAHVPRLGSIAATKPDGSWRWMYCQLNGCATREIRARKVEEMTQLAQKYDVDGIVAAELGYNWSTVASSKNFASWFEVDRETRSSTSHNIHGPRTSEHQQGGTGIMLFNEILQFAKKPAGDFRKLGRWTSWLFYVNPEHKFRVIVAYNLGSAKPKGLKTQYQQHLSHIQNKNLQCDPRTLFRRDFEKQLKIWRKAGERLLLFMDANEHVLDGPLNKMLAQEEIGLNEISHKNWPEGEEPNTFIDGTIPIDGTYATDDVEEEINMVSLSFHESAGDHKTVILDISTRAAIGKFQSKIVRPSTRRLTTKQPVSVDSYNGIVEDHFKKHRIIERLEALDNLTKICGTPSPDWLKARILTIHKQLDEIRIHAERKCRKLLKPDMEFSPTIQYWYDRIHAYRQLIKIRKNNGSNIDRSRAVRTAKRKKIKDPKGLSIAQCKDGITYAKNRQKTLKRQATGLRKVHLRDRLIAARHQDDPVKEKAIKLRIEREYSKKVWYQIKRVTKPSSTRACLEVEEVVDGVKTEFTGKDPVEECVRRECEVRFQLGHSAPINKTLLAEDLKYLGDSEIAKKIFTGTYEIPDEVDNATALILTEIGKLGMKITRGEEKDIEITPDDFKRYWKRVDEGTSSSMAGLHHGHYKAAAQSDVSCKALSLQMTVIVRSGIHPDRWSIALQVLLEKVAGVCIVEKLRMIQLYEGDFNWFNKFIFGDMAMKALIEAGSLPEEHFSQGQSTAEDAAFDKTLTTDISRQARHPMAVVSVDAEKCYDRVNHLLMSLVWLALINHIGSISIALACLQFMKFFQRTGYGDSTSYCGGKRSGKTWCGLGQGSKGAPASWLQMSSMIVNAYKSMDYGAAMMDPVTRLLIYSIGCLFVDDTDLYIWKDDLKTGREVWEQTQEEVTLWGNLLIATGGAVKVDKSFWYLLDYECIEGQWQPMTMVDYDLRVPTPDGYSDALDQHDVTHSKETLGLQSCPAGGSADQLVSLREKMESWSTKMTNGHLPSSLAWLSYRNQLWPGIRYGLGTLTNDMEEAETLFDKCDYTILSSLGVCRNIKTGWRRLHQTFGGVGLLHLPTEQLICRINLFLQHYHTSSTLSKKLDASLRWMQLQLGTNKCPFELEYEVWGYLAPLSWVKVFWRSLQSSKMEIQMVFDEIPIPRVNDMTIMDIVYSKRPPTDVMESLNRCRVYLHLLFLSDMVTANGRKLEQSTVKAPFTPINSTMAFPREEPSMTDWQHWERFWNDISYDSLTLWRPLGKWINPTHRQWVWFFDEKTQQLQQQEEEGISYYVPSSLRNRTRSEQLYRKAWSDTEAGTTGVPISVTVIDDSTVIKGEMGTPIASGPSQPQDFWAYLDKWGGTWMWESLHLDQTSHTDQSWLIQAIKKDTAIWVTDGSYDRKRAPTISGAGWLVYCSATGRKLAGSFYEISPAASSYRGEMLGLCAIHLFCLAIMEFYDIKGGHNKLCCDNMGALKQSSWNRRRVKTGAKCADILRSIRNTKNEMTMKFSYEHVDAHMDRHLLWQQLTLEQQLNVMCDSLAKSAVSRSISFEPTSTDRGKQLLPRESAALYVRDVKQTSDPSSQIRFEISSSMAKTYLVDEIKWTAYKYDQVAWDWLDKTLASKPDNYKVWLCKQHSNFNGSRVQVARYQGLDDARCPSCLEKEERASHLCICPDKDRTHLFRESTANLEGWLSDWTRTNPEIAYWVPKYILGRGTLKFAELGSMSAPMEALAKSQDEIGWRNFMEGRISKHFFSMQLLYLTTASSFLNGSDWMRTFISKIIHITHSQWIYRNFMLHDRRLGYLRLRNRVEILTEIEVLHDTAPHELPTESRFLLEFDLDEMCNADLDKQQYWVHSMKAARKAGRRTARRGARGRQQYKNRQKLPLKTRLGVDQVINQIREDRKNLRYSTFFPTALTLRRKRSSSAGMEAELKSNKRLRNPD